MHIAKQVRSHRPGGPAGLGATVGAALMVCVVLMMAGALISGCGSKANGESAPDFSGVTLDGNEVSLSEYRGKPLVLAFMASW